MAELTRPSCGMTKAEWKGNNGRVVTKDGQPYRCRGCAEITGCTCRWG
jgi:hypothetical protein